MKKKAWSRCVIVVGAAAAALALVMLGGPVHVAGAVNCNAIELMPCLPAMITAAPPTQQCCAKLKEQQACLCGYLNDPRYNRYISLPGAQKVSAACGIPFPQCN